jgi:hypothetical protein
LVILPDSLTIWHRNGWTFQIFLDSLETLATWHKHNMANGLDGMASTTKHNTQHPD